MKIIGTDINAEATSMYSKIVVLLTIDELSLILNTDNEGLSQEIHSGTRIFDIADRMRGLLRFQNEKSQLLKNIMYIKSRIAEIDHTISETSKLLK